jgi:hypothetical protein
MDLNNQAIRESRLLRIDSRDRNSGTPTNFNSHLNDYLLHNIQRVLLKSVFIPNTAYNVSIYKNTLVYDAGSGQQTLTVPIGQYNLTELMDELISLFALAIPAVTLSYSYDTKTSKLLLNTIPATILYGAESTISDLLGMGNQTLGLSGVHALPNVINLSGLQKVYIGSHTMAKGTTMTSTDERHIKIFTEIPITVPYGAIQHRVLDSINSIDETSHSIPFNVSSPDITLFDQDLNVLELNGSEWQIVLKVYPQFTNN